MNVLKQVLACACAAAWCALARGDGADNVTLKAQTTGPDCYIDGTVVMDGECYALVWSLDGEFEGFDANGDPLDPEDRLVNVGTAARKGRCNTQFIIRASEMAKLLDGYFAIYLLDTRVQGEEGLVPAGAQNRRPNALNGYVRVTENLKAGPGELLVRFTEAETESEEVAHRASTLVSATRDVQQPRILKISPKSDEIELWVENVGGLVRVQGGGDLTASGATSGAVDADSVEGDVLFVMPRTGDRGFFKAVR